MSDRTDPVPPAWHALDVHAVEDRLGSSARGLPRDEVAARRAHHGPNRIDDLPPTRAVVILFRQMRNPLIAIMTAALVITLLLQEYLDAAVVAVALALNAIVGFTQERKAETTVRALMSLVVPHAHVVRDGREEEIESVDLVPGDIVVFEPGSRVPADLRITSTNALRIDESLLTGESVSVSKHVEPVAADAVLADRTSMAYAGSIVSSGRGLGVVVTTGVHTELGAIAGLIRSGIAPRTPLQVRMQSFAKVIAIAVVLSSTVAFVSGLLLGESADQMFLVAVALAVAAVPEGLPVATTIALAIGVSRMARRHAILRRLPAVETLGSVTVIGSDKTGTLTENRMTVQEIWVHGHDYRLVGGVPDGDLLDADDEPAALEFAPALHRTLLGGVLNNEAEVHRRDGELASIGDPTEVALLEVALTAAIEAPDARAAYPTVAEIPFEPARRFSAEVCERKQRTTMFVKGAPERVIRMCTRILTDDGVVPLTPGEVEAAAAAMAERGLRVLAFAERDFEGDVEAVDVRHDPEGLTFCGLQGMLDPPRPGVRDAIADCHDAGIRVMMITGDHAATAQAIAAHLGIEATGPEATLDGSQLATLDDAALAVALDDLVVVARASPEQKLRVVRALQAAGNVVAVTGDGANDAPALKAAQIGIAMGKGGTDVAREAADMVLTDDNFVSIVAAVEEGRVTFDNIRKVAFFLVSTGVATVSTILAAVWLQWPLIMLPAQLLWLNLVTSGLQDLALAFEPGEPGVLRRRPRRRDEGIMSATLWERCLVGGAVMAAGTLWLFHWELESTGSLVMAQTVALTTMVVYQVFQAGNARSEHLSLFRMSPFSNRFLFLASAAAVGVHVAALYLPPTQYVLRVEPIGVEAWARIVIVASSLLIATEAHKAFRRRVPLPTR